jgi:hypothetical protein
MTEANAASQHAPQEPSGQAQTATPGDGSSTLPKLSGAALWVAVFAIAVWIGFSVFLITRAGTSETEWARIAWVFGSIQAIAFAAAGALFGTAVQQQNVDDAQQRAASARNDADQQREAAAKGRALAVAIQAEEAAQTASGAGGIRRAAVTSSTGTGSADELLHRHAQLSQALFGDLL